MCFLNGFNLAITVMEVAVIMMMKMSNNELIIFNS